MSCKKKTSNGAWSSVFLYICRVTWKFYYRLMISKTMLNEKIQYIVALIAEFAAHYHLTDAQAARYMSRYGAIEMCDKHYNVMHTLPWIDNIQSIATYCRRKGGEL